MNKISGFKIDQLPVWKITFAITSNPDYEMDRVIYLEEYPGLDDYTLVTGGHCSCFDFDDTEWEAITYTREELKAVLNGWLTGGYGAEAIAAPIILEYMTS